MGKLDLNKEHKLYYKATPNPEIVEFGHINYLTITGKGEPAGEEFSEKAATLYPVAYGIKKICKIKSRDFVVPKLEGLWWAESTQPLLSVLRSEWYWKLLIRMPEFVDTGMLQTITLEILAKKKLKLASHVKLEAINEGKSVSILHVGPYSTELESISLMEKCIKESKLSKNGQHHEIYLSDPNKTAPGKIKKILRQPVK